MQQLEGGFTADPSPLSSPDSEAFAAVEGLIMALDDPDRGVVLQAIESLEFAGDESVIPALSPLLDDSDRAIREAAAEAIEFLTD